MPRLDSEIPLETHKDDCPNPTAKRLYIKNYDDRGNQKIVRWGLTCENCGVVIAQPYKHNLTKRQRDKQMSMPKLPFKILNEDTTTASATTTSQKLSKEELETTYRKRLKDIKIRRLKQKQAANAHMDHLEMKTRQKIRGLNTIYKEDEKRYPRLKGRINWDKELVEKFLAVRPTYGQMHEILNWPPLYRQQSFYYLF